MKSWFKHAQPLVLAVALAAAFGACDEQLDAGLACPALCPGQQLTLRDTTLLASVDLDTSIAGFPSLGAELQFFIASMGDTLQTRAVVRYDSLPVRFRANTAAEDSLIYAVDTGAYVRLTIVTGDTLGAPTTIEVYDVDLGGAEEADPAAVASAFTPDRLLGTRTIPADSLRDSVRVPIDNAKLLEKILTPAPGNRLRLGFKVSSTGTTRLLMESSNSFGAEPTLIFRPSDVDTVPINRMAPMSRTPDNNEFVRSDMADYLVVVTAPPPPQFDALRVGGLPGRRGYLRLDIPQWLLDSTTIVRATLLLTQRPNLAAPEPNDSVAIQALGVSASNEVTDLSRALVFMRRFRDADTVRVVAADSGVREFEIINLVRSWKGTTAAKTPRAIALASTVEGRNARMIDFFSREAVASVRPRVRITYMPLAVGGLP